MVDLLFLFFLSMSTIFVVSPPSKVRYQSIFWHLVTQYRHNIKYLWNNYMRNINFCDLGLECENIEIVQISWYNFLVGSSVSPKMCDIRLSERLYKVLFRNYFSAAHILSKKGMKGMNPSSSSGSQSSFIRPLASSLVSFSPRFVMRRNNSFPCMVLSSFLS